MTSVFQMTCFIRDKQKRRIFVPDYCVILQPRETFILSLLLCCIDIHSVFECHLQNMRLLDPLTLQIIPCIFFNNGIYNNPSF